MTVMTLKDERDRLRKDYPGLSARFMGGRGNWVCHLRIRTQAFGFFTIRLGHGTTQREALLAARAKHDAAFSGGSTLASVETPMEQGLLQRTV
jgi:hypothetical protein